MIQQFEQESRVAFKLVHAPVASRLQPQTRTEGSFRGFFIWGAEGGGGGGAGTFVLRRRRITRAGRAWATFFVFSAEECSSVGLRFPPVISATTAPFEITTLVLAFGPFFTLMIRRTARFCFHISIWVVEVCRRFLGGCDVRSCCVRVGAPQTGVLGAVLASVIGAGGTSGCAIITFLAWYDAAQRRSIVPSLLRCFQV